MNKRGTLVQKAPGKWLLRVYAGRDPMNPSKRLYPSRTFEGTTAQARQALTKMLSEHDQTGPVQPSKLSLAKYLPEWLAGRLRITERTRASYRHIIDRHLIPSLGNVALAKLEARQVQQFITKLVEQGLSPRTVQYCYTVLHAAMASASKQRLVLKNPVEDIELPKRRKSQPTTLTIRQVDLLLEATRNHTLHCLWRLLLTTGIRQQEAFGLAWKDVDLDGRWVSIRQTLVGDGKGKFGLEEATKTDGSVRRVSLPESTAEAMRAYKAAQSAEILQTGPSYARNGLVFANSVGNPLDPNRIRKVWDALLVSQGLPRVKLSGTRHTHATNLLQAGVNLAWVSERLGHTDIKITRDTYAHVLPETQAEMGEITERMLKAAQQA